MASMCCSSQVFLALVVFSNFLAYNYAQQIKNGDCMYDFTLPENRLLVKCGDKTAITRFTANASSAFPSGNAARTTFQKPPPKLNFNYTSVSASTDRDLTLIQRVMDDLRQVNMSLVGVKTQINREMDMIGNAAAILFADEAKANLAGVRQPMRRPTAPGGRRRPGGMPPMFRAALAKIQTKNDNMLKGVKEQNVAVEEAIESLNTLIKLEGEMVAASMTLAEVLSRRVKELTAPLAFLQSSGKLQQDFNGHFPKPKQQFREMFNRPNNPGPQTRPYNQPRPQYPLQNRPQYPRPSRGPSRLPGRILPNSPIRPRQVPISVPKPSAAGKPLILTNPVTCSALTSIGSAYMWVHQGATQGTIMADYKDRYGRIWAMLGYGGTNQIIEYENDLAFESSEVGNTYVLPFYCEGTGHVMYGGSLYCLQSKTNHLVKYDIASGTILKEVRLVSAGVYNTYPYQFGALSDIDFAVDEIGLWVIYSGSKYYGRLVISKLNPDTLDIEQTWVTDILKKRIGNSFMVCGVLYAIDSFTDAPTFIRYQYDTKTGKGQILSPATYPFINTADNSQSNSFTVMADYDAKERRLFTWNTGRIEVYQIM